MVVLGCWYSYLSLVILFKIPSEATEELANSMSVLVAQLSSSKVDFDRRVLAQMIESDATDVFIATQSNDVVGTLTLLVGRIPTGTRCFIEDVVVDSKARGSGLGEALVRAALDRAKERGAKTVDLTSRPGRDAANRLYLRCGFALRDTNVYRYQLSDLAGRNVR
jgi:ribosomal protein S18 acetylase RimI-like enzyme